MNAQEYFDSLPSHFVKITPEAIVRNWLVGQYAVANHPETVLNSNRKGFSITEVKIINDRIKVRGENTCWFDQDLIKIDICPI